MGEGECRIVCKFTYVTVSWLQRMWKRTRRESSAEERGPRFYQEGKNFQKTEEMEGGEALTVFLMPVFHLDTEDFMVSNGGVRLCVVAWSIKLTGTDRTER